MVGSKGGDGNGYIAQVKEMELLRRENVRLVGEAANKDAAVDHMRNQVNLANGTIRELHALATHHVRMAFVLGLGAGLAGTMMAWGVVALVR